MPKKRTKKKKEEPEGLAIPAGLFIGMGVGFITGDFVAWMFIGLGAGFLFMLLSNAFSNNFS
jgi:hypothetical protein